MVPFEGKTQLNRLKSIRQYGKYTLYSDFRYHTTEGVAGCNGATFFRSAHKLKLMQKNIDNPMKVTNGHVSNRGSHFFFFFTNLVEVNQYWNYHNIRIRSLFTVSFAFANFKSSLKNRCESFDTYFLVERIYFEKYFRTLIGIFPVIKFRKVAFTYFLS